MLATPFLEPFTRWTVLCESPVLLVVPCHSYQHWDSGSVFLKNIFFPFPKCSLAFGERWKNLYLLFWLHISPPVLTGLCGCCIYSGGGWVSICGEQQSFHSPSVRLWGSLHFWAGVCDVNVSRSSSSWHHSFRFLSGWMILAKQELEVTHPLATGMTSLRASSEIHFYSLVLKCCSRKFLQIRGMYCFIDTSLCHHSMFPSASFFLLFPPQFLPSPQIHKKSQADKKKFKINKHTYMIKVKPSWPDEN